MIFVDDQMSIRLIASDMDGTLLNPYTNISLANIDAIRRLPDYGVEFLICSGRDHRDAKEIMDSYDITCGYICLSGAVIYDRDGNQRINLPLTEQNLKDISHIFGKFGSSMDILASTGRYSTADPEKKLGSMCSGSDASLPDFEKNFYSAHSSKYRLISPLLRIVTSHNAPFFIFSFLTSG